MAYENSGYKRGRSFASSPFIFLMSILGWIIGFLFTVFIILTPISMVYQNNVLVSFYYSEVTDPLLNTGVGNFIKKGVTILTLPFNTQQQADLLESYTWKTTIDEGSTKKDLGVKITSLRTNEDIINIERFPTIELVAEVSASSSEPLEIKFSCLTEDNQEGEVANKNNIKFISSNTKEVFTVKCLYKKENFEIDETKTSTQKIRIRSTYDFVTDAYMPIYLLQKDILDYKIEEGNKGPVRQEYNIFEDENINDPNLNKKDKITSSVYTKGPMKLALRSLYSQPYTEEGPFGEGSSYNLDIKIDDDLQWTGNIEEIEDFYLYIPEELDLTTDKFEYFENEDNFKIYKAKSTTIDELHKKCEPKSDLNKLRNLIDEDCWRSGNMIVSAEFSVNNPPEDISQTFIRTKIIYKFNDEKRKSITFLSSENV